MIYLILTLATALRLIDLGNLPISLFSDEVDVAYHAWSIWNTGKDYMGNFLPTYIRSLSEWRAPLIMYVTAPFVGLFGLSAFSARLPVALLGVLDIYLIYLLTNQLLPKLKLKLGKFDISAGDVSALLLTLTPWHLHYSRANFEVTLLIALLLLGTYWFIKFIKNPKLPFILFPIPLALTFYTYSTANLFTPLLAISLLLIYKPNLKKMFFNYWQVWLSTLIIILPISYHLTLGQAAGRFNLVSIFSSQKLIDSIILTRTEPWVNAAREALFHNKPLKFSTTFITHYLQSFSPQFLFISGDPFPRHSVVGFGQLLWVTLPMFVAGMFSLAKSFSKKSSQLLLAWLLMSPIPSALTIVGGTHATRLFIMLPALIVISTLGFFHLKKLLSKNLEIIAATVFIGALLVNVALYAHQYSAHYRYKTAAYWQYGYKDIFTQLKPHLDTDSRIFINNSHEPALLQFAFHTDFPPSKFHQYFSGDQVQDGLLENFNGFKFGPNIYFGQIIFDQSNPADKRIRELIDEGDIYMVVQGIEAPGNWNWTLEEPGGFESIGTTSDVFGDPLFHLIRKT